MFAAMTTDRWGGAHPVLSVSKRNSRSSMSQSPRRTVNRHSGHYTSRDFTDSQDIPDKHLAYLLDVKKKGNPPFQTDLGGIKEKPDKHLSYLHNLKNKGNASLINQHASGASMVTQVGSYANTTPKNLLLNEVLSESQKKELNNMGLLAAEYIKQRVQDFNPPPRNNKKIEEPLQEEDFPGGTLHTLNSLLQAQKELSGIVDYAASEAREKRISLLEHELNSLKNEQQRSKEEESFFLRNAVEEVKQKLYEAKKNTEKLEQDINVYQEKLNKIEAEKEGPHPQSMMPTRIMPPMVNLGNNGSIKPCPRTTAVMPSLLSPRGVDYRTNSPRQTSPSTQSKEIPLPMNPFRQTSPGSSQRKSLPSNFVPGSQVMSPNLNHSNTNVNTHAHGSTTSCSTPLVPPPKNVTTYAATTHWEKQQSATSHSGQLSKDTTATTEASTTEAGTVSSPSHPGKRTIQPILRNQQFFPMYSSQNFSGIGRKSFGGTTQQGSVIGGYRSPLAPPRENVEVPLRRDQGAPVLPTFQQYSTTNVMPFRTASANMVMSPRLASNPTVSTPRVEMFQHQQSQQISCPSNQQQPYLVKDGSQVAGNSLNGSWASTNTIITKGAIPASKLSSSGTTYPTLYYSEGQVKSSTTPPTHEKSYGSPLTGASIPTVKSQYAPIQPIQEHPTPNASPRYVGQSDADMGAGDGKDSSRRQAPTTEKRSEESSTEWLEGRELSD